MSKLDTNINGEAPYLLFKFNDGALISNDGSYSIKSINNNGCILNKDDFVKGNGCAQFTGSSYFYIKTNETFNSQNFSISFFIKIAINQNNIIKVIASNSYEDSNTKLGWILCVNNKSLELKIGTGKSNTWNTIISYPDFIDNNPEWRHLAFTYDRTNNNNWNLYIDGVFIIKANGEYIPIISKLIDDIRIIPEVCNIEYVDEMKNYCTDITEKRGTGTYNYRNGARKNRKVKVLFHCGSGEPSLEFGVGENQYLHSGFEYNVSGLLIPTGMRIVLIDVNEVVAWWRGCGPGRTRTFTSGYYGCLWDYSWNDKATHISVYDDVPEYELLRDEIFIDVKIGENCVRKSTGRKIPERKCKYNVPQSFMRAPRENELFLIIGAEGNLTSQKNYVPRGTLIDDFHFYNRTLNSDEISELYMGYKLPKGSSQPPSTDCDPNDKKITTRELILIPSPNTKISVISDIIQLENNKYSQTFIIGAIRYQLYFSQILNNRKDFSPANLFNKGINMDKDICAFANSKAINNSNYNSEYNYDYELLKLSVPNCGSFTNIEIKGDYLYINTGDSFVLGRYGIKGLPDFLQRAPSYWTLFIYDSKNGRAISFQQTTKLTRDDYCTNNQNVYVYDINYDKDTPQIESNEYLFVFQGIIGGSKIDPFRLLAFKELVLYQSIV